MGPSLLRIVSSVEPMLHPPHKLPSRFHSNPEEATSAELPSSRALTSCQLVTAKSPVPSPELPSPWRVFSTTTWPRSSPLLHGRSTLLRPRHHHQLRLLCHHSYQRRHLEARSCWDHRSPSCRTRVHRSRNHLRMGQDQRHQRSPPSQPPDHRCPTYVRCRLRCRLGNLQNHPTVPVRRSRRNWIVQRRLWRSTLAKRRRCQLPYRKHLMGIINLQR